MRLQANKARPWLLAQDEIWVTKTGEVKHLESLDRDHVVNLIAFLLRDRRNGSLAHVAGSPLMNRLLCLSKPNPMRRYDTWD